MSKCGWCLDALHEQCFNGHKPIGSNTPDCTCDHGGRSIELKYTKPPKGKYAMSDKITKTEADEALTLASDGRTISDFPNLEDLRLSYAETYGKRKFSRSAVGAEMGVPGPTIQRIERVTPKTTAVELEELENVLNRMADDAQALADAEEADDEDDEDE